MIYAYREDINSAISPAGNKLRKLSYVLPHALSNPNLKALVTVGGVQSNCCRQAAAVAAKLGLKCIVALTQEVDPQHQSTTLYNSVGNVQLERLLGADVRILGPSRDGAQHSAEVDGKEWSSLAHGLSKEDAEGAYFLSQGASGNPGAGVGYAKWVFDMLEKESVLREDGTLQGSGVFDTIVVACATGGTLAGMVAGMRLAENNGYINNPKTRRRIIGIETFAKDPQSQRDMVLGIARDTAALIGLRRDDIRPGDVVVDGRWTAGGYGIYDELTRQTIKMVARTEAMLLDPVYTGKAMAAVLQGVRTGELHGNVLFVHTGGSPVLPAYLGIEQD